MRFRTHTADRRRYLEEAMAEIGSKIGTALDALDDEIVELKRRRHDLYAAWKDNDFEWIANQGILSADDLDAINELDDLDVRG
jgi:hypothetical protein